MNTFNLFATILIFQICILLVITSVLHINSGYAFVAFAWTCPWYLVYIKKHNSTKKEGK